jgi:hypothetical protein
MFFSARDNGFLTMSPGTSSNAVGGNGIEFFKMLRTWENHGKSGYNRTE